MRTPTLIALCLLIASPATAGMATNYTLNPSQQANLNASNQQVQQLTDQTRLLSELVEKQDVQMQALQQIQAQQAQQIQIQQQVLQQLQIQTQLQSQPKQPNY